jgi:flagellar protein FlgJ
MVAPVDISGKLAIDAKEVGALRQSAKDNSPEALKAAAKQFEAVFMNMILKSMREATPQDGMLDNEQSRMYTSMLDQQLSQTMASRGVGLADMLVRQLSGMTQPGSQVAASHAATPGQAAADAPLATPAAGTPVAASDASRTSGAQPAHVREFQEKMGPHAEEASRATGIPAKFMLGQAALESGWGKREIVGNDGTRSHNLFGIKANAAWKGKVVEAPTTEYINGVPQTRMEKFRAYDSYADSFRDYAQFMRSNPRYESVLANAQDVAGFAQGLQRAGYATDPHYAAKLTRIINHSLST